jgi:hypothetical protein
MVNVHECLAQCIETVARTYTMNLTINLQGTEGECNGNLVRARANVAVAHE